MQTSYKQTKLEKQYGIKAEKFDGGAKAWAEFETRIVAEIRELRWSEKSKFDALDWEIVEVLAWKAHACLPREKIEAIVKAVGVYVPETYSKERFDKSLRRLSRAGFIYGENFRTGGRHNRRTVRGYGINLNRYDVSEKENGF